MADTFVLHEHFSKHHHFDFRLEHDGVLASWAVPKGLPEKPGERRLAIQVEDHPLSYGTFEGTIPGGEYGAGEVKIADAGTYETLAWTNERIEVLLHGKEHTGKYVLLRFAKAGEKNWIVLKGKEA
ncbi:DNA polymerase ligase N-terminal domain-containing protein [Methanoregula sp. UBA64]|jgi:DNA ligase D-like protein (predicted 3'-phosphoesterase)|uniref:DNA polymerase ligase N-terminal domain-containing protein n=1 Tax=Methanoregula sp. UBA64 TaxID=1915554 RepID=UPI0025D1228D|nr:DNA polymerase ligase N-terminal domain-containing protein [Methanoregula sp. UBA64]